MENTEQKGQSLPEVEAWQDQLDRGYGSSRPIELAYFEAPREVIYLGSENPLQDLQEAIDSMVDHVVYSLEFPHKPLSLRPEIKREIARISAKITRQNPNKRLQVWYELEEQGIAELFFFELTQLR